VNWVGTRKIPAAQPGGGEMTVFPKPGRQKPSLPTGGARTGQVFRLVPPARLPGKIPSGARGAGLMRD
jgi:hypothetical protein